MPKWQNVKTAERENGILRGLVVARWIGSWPGEYVGNLSIVHNKATRLIQWGMRNPRNLSTYSVRSYYAHSTERQS